jgi:hypothetical protein
MERVTRYPLCVRVRLRPLTKKKTRPEMWWKGRGQHAHSGTDDLTWLMD